jgi:prephenate dehydratase
MVPLVNSTHGMVIETYDQLRSERVPRDFSIIGDITIKVELCLVVLGPGGSAISLDDVRTQPVPQQSTPVTTATRGEDILKGISVVYSHEQALGQCADWLNRNLPNAKRVAVSSTAAAAKMLLQPPIGHPNTPLSPNMHPRTEGIRAAVASEICLRLYPELSLVQKGIQDDSSTSRLHNYAKYHQISSILAREPNKVYSDLQILSSNSNISDAPSTVKGNSSHTSDPFNRFISSSLTSRSYPPNCHLYNRPSAH